MAASVVVAVSLVSGCGAAHSGTDASGLPVEGPVSKAEVARIPESHLRYPGSTLVQVVGANQSPTHPGEEPNPAYSGSILITRATPSQLYSWYAGRLAARGYRPATDYRPANQSSGRAWERDHRVQVQVGVFEPGAVQVALRPGEIAYEQVLVGYPPGLPKD